LAKLSFISKITKYNDTVIKKNTSDECNPGNYLYRENDDSDCPQFVSNAFFIPEVLQNIVKYYQDLYPVEENNIIDDEFTNQFNWWMPQNLWIKRKVTPLYPNNSDNILFTFRPGEASKIQYVGAGWNVVGQPTFIVTAVSLDPNDQYTGTITITGGTFVSGQSYSFESPNVNITGTANLILDTNLATLSQGTAQGIPGIVVPVTAPGTPTTWGSNGWGQLGWGENIGLTTLEGTATIDLITPVNVTGQLLSASLNSVTIVGTVVAVS
jgi:hypothetical protein